MLLIVLACLIPNVSNASWLHLATPDVNIYSESRFDAEPLIVRLETMKQFFEQTPWRMAATRVHPTILIFSNEAEFADYRSRPDSSGFFQQVGSERYIALNQNSTDFERTAAHEYVHCIFSVVAPHLPRWVSEGLAETLAGGRIVDGQLQLGIAVPEYVRDLRQSPELIREILDANDDAEFDRGSTADVSNRYSASWAVIHMLLTDRRYTPRFSLFLDALNSGGRDTIWEAVYGDTKDSIERHALASLDELQGYSSLFPSRVLLAATKSGYSSQASDEVFVALADLVRLGSAQQIILEERLRELTTTFSDPALDGALGLLLYRSEHGGDEAEDYCTKALQRGLSGDNRVLRHFVETMIRYNRNARVPLTWLEGAVHQSGNDPEELLMIGMLAAKEREYKLAVQAFALTEQTSTTHSHSFNILATSAYCYLQVGLIREAKSDALLAAGQAVSETEVSYSQKLLRTVSQAEHHLNQRQQG